MTLAATTSLTPTATFTVTPSPTPAQAVLAPAAGKGISLRQEPNGPVIGGYISPGEQMTVLYGYQIVDGSVWIEVTDLAGMLWAGCRSSIPRRLLQHPAQRSTWESRSLIQAGTSSASNCSKASRASVP